MKKHKIKSYSTFIIFLIASFYINPIFSQNKTVTFNHLSAKNGLSQNGVMAIFKDSKGYMWFGTRDGLNRYDGYRFKVYKHDNLDANSISNNFITTITEDGNGRLWIGTKNGLNSFNRVNEKFTVYKNDSTINNSISNNDILSILCDSNGGLWVGTENGLNLMTQNTTSFKRFHNIFHNQNSLSGNHIYAIYEDSKNNIWIGTKFGGLNKFIKNSNQFTRYKHDPTNSNSISSNFIGTIVENKDGKLWIGTIDNGISILNKDGIFSHIKHLEESDNSLSNNIIWALDFDEHSNLWIATYDGLNYYNTETHKFEVYKSTTGNSGSISHNSIRSLLLDDDDFLWAGTYFGGLNLLNLNSKQFTHFKHNPIEQNSLSNNIVGAMVEDKQGNIWIGTEGGGLNYFDYLNQSFSRIDAFHGKELNCRTIKSLLVDKNQNLWIGTHLNGLKFLNFKTGTIQEYYHEKDNQNSLSDNSIISLIEDQSGRIWIGSESGLNTFDPKTLQINRVQLQKNDSSIMTLFEDSSNNIWVGTKQNGLLLVEQGTIKHYIHDSKNSNSISHNSIYTIFEDSKNQLWIGTYGGGLNLMNRTNNTFIKYRVRDGLVNDIVYNIEEDLQNNLWISTPSGISKFEQEYKIFKNYTPNNGLSIEEFNEKSSLNHSKGHIFFGGLDGFISFNPENIHVSSFTPDLSLTELKLLNKLITPNDKSGLLKKPLNETDEITFSHAQSIFSIDYIALNYDQLGQNKYAYMLDGLETDWNYVGYKRSATYTNLDAGKYTFKLKSANTDGIWNQNIVTLNIIKLPPYWKTTWAYILYTIIAILLFLIIRKYFLIKLHLENNLKLEKLEKQQLEDLTKLKLKFFTNISHDFRTPLTLIHGPLQELIGKFKTQEANSHLLLIKKNVSLMLRLVNQLMDFRKLQTSTLSLLLAKEPLVPFIKEIIFSFQELAKTNDIKFSFTTSIPNKKILFDKDKIEKILYNLLSNAFKYTPLGGEITVKIQEKHGQSKEDIDCIEIIIRNTGHGIEKENLKNIFDRFFQGYDQIEHPQKGSGIGLSLVKNLVEIHKGYIKVQSELDKHTEFTVGIPSDDIYTEEEKLFLESQWELDKNKGSANSKVIPKNNKENKKHSILVIEDNYDLKKFLIQTLSPIYDVFSAENGEIGLSMVKKHRPNIIVSDIMMPKMTGLELCKILKADSKTSHIPIILLTARTALSIELDGYDTGANDFISKPFNIEILKSKIHNLIHSMNSIKNYSRKEVLLKDSEIYTDSADEKFLEKLSTYIRDNITDPELNVNKVGKELGLSRMHFYRKVKAITETSPVEFIRNYRLSIAAKLLEQDNYNINEVSYKVGFQDVSYFRKCFKKKYGISSTNYAKMKKKTSINK